MRNHINATIAVLFTGAMLLITNTSIAHEGEYARGGHR